MFFFVVFALALIAFLFATLGCTIFFTFGAIGMSFWIFPSIMSSVVVAPLMSWVFIPACDNPAGFVQRRGYGFLLLVSFWLLCFFKHKHIMKMLLIFHVVNNSFSFVGLPFLTLSYTDMVIASASVLYPYLHKVWAVYLVDDRIGSMLLTGLVTVVSCLLEFSNGSTVILLKAVKSMSFAYMSWFIHDDRIRTIVANSIRVWFWHCLKTRAHEWWNTPSDFHFSDVYNFLLQLPFSLQIIARQGNKFS